MDNNQIKKSASNQFLGEMWDMHAPENHNSTASPKETQPVFEKRIPSGQFKEHLEGIMTKTFENPYYPDYLSKTL